MPKCDRDDKVTHHLIKEHILWIKLNSIKIKLLRCEKWSFGGCTTSRNGGINLVVGMYICRVGQSEVSPNPAGPRLSKRIKMARRIGHSLLRQDGPEQPNSGPWCPRRRVYISWLAPKEANVFATILPLATTHPLVTLLALKCPALSLAVVCLQSHLHIASYTRCSPTVHFDNKSPYISKLDPKQGNEIRTITLQPGKWSDDISCSLQVVSLDDNPDLCCAVLRMGGSKPNSKVRSYQYHFGLGLRCREIFTDILLAKFTPTLKQH